MTYRIRYKMHRESMESEVIVEANSPNEAMVKFRCLSDGKSVVANQHDLITSVSQVERNESGTW